MDRSRNKDRTESTTTLNHVIHSVFISTVLDWLSFYMLLPLLPNLITYYGEFDNGRLFTSIISFTSYLREQVAGSDIPHLNTVLIGGLLVSICSFVKFLSLPLIRVLSDVYGRKNLVIGTLMGMAISYLLWVVSRTFTIFFISRLLAGFCKGNCQLGACMMTDVTHSKTRNEALLTLDLAVLIAFTAGPVISGLIVYWFRSYSKHFFISPAYFAMCLTLLNIFYCVFYLQETLPDRKRSRQTSRNRKWIMELINPLRLFQFRLAKRLDVIELTNMQFFCAIHFFYVVLVSGFEFSLPFLTAERFSSQPLNQALVFCFVGFVTSVIQFSFIRKIKAGKEYFIIIGGMLGVLISMFMVAFAKTLFDLCVGLFFYSLGTASVLPTFHTLIVSSTRESKFHIQSIFHSQKALAEAIGPLAISISFWHVGGQATCILYGLVLLVPLVFLIT